MPANNYRLIACYVLIGTFVVGCVTQEPMVLRDDTLPLPLPVVEEPISDGLTQLIPPGDLTARPFTPSSDAPLEYWELTLGEVIRIALENSDVLRHVGGRIIQTPELQPTIYGPAIRGTDPRFGVEAALSQYDALFTTSAVWDRNDRVLNNILLGGGVNIFNQELFRVRPGITKRTATGAELSFSHLVTNDSNNATRNIFQTYWEPLLEAQFRQPLLQGAGVEFNRIAGRSNTPGVVNGVVIARLDTDISVADFELALRDYLSNVENAYWNLYFAYRDLDAKKNARDRTLETWNNLEQRTDTKADLEAQAREQYFRFQNEVDNALSGRLTQRTRTFNGSPAGTFQSEGGVYVSERELRFIMGVPINDGVLIRPATEPPEAATCFDWERVSNGALADRPELNKQRLEIQRRDYDLIAQRNYLKPQLDLIGTYRWRGLGENLYDYRVPAAAVGAVDNPGTISSSRSEWQVGMELSYPLGFRQANSAVRNAELRLARERAVLRDMERRVVHDLSNAITNSERAHQSLQTNLNRYLAAVDELTALEERKERVPGPIFESYLNQLLDSQRRVAEAEIATYRARVEYALALKNVQFEMGNLLSYYEVSCVGDEGATWDPTALN